MKWSMKNSVCLSRVFIGFFAVLLLGLDVMGFFTSEMEEVLKPSQLNWLRACVYACSVPAWVALWDLWKLTWNLEKGQVFTPGTIRLTRIIAWCCFAAAIISCVCALFIHVSVIVVSVAAALMGLIVRMVKNVLEQALAMKNELDYTV